MSQEKIDALAIGSSSPVFSAIEKLVLKFTEETVLQQGVCNETFDAISRYLSYELLVELAIAAECYMMVSIFLNTFDVEIEKEDVPF